MLLDRKKKLSNSPANDYQPSRKEKSQISIESWDRRTFLSKCIPPFWAVALISSNEFSCLCFWKCREYLCVPRRMMWMWMKWKRKGGLFFSRAQDTDQYQTRSVQDESNWQSSSPCSWKDKHITLMCVYLNDIYIYSCVSLERKEGRRRKQPNEHIAIDCWHPLEFVEILSWNFPYSIKLSTRFPLERILSLCVYI